MNVDELCNSLRNSLSPLFVCSPAPKEGVRVRTPMLYPDGGVVDVFVLERDDTYIITDHGDALGWLGLQSLSQKLTHKQNSLLQDLCQTLGLELSGKQLLLQPIKKDELGEAVVRVAQGVVRVADLWFTLRAQTFQATAEEVGDWLEEKQIPFRRQVKRQGRSTREWKIDFETKTNHQTSLIFLLSAVSQNQSTRITEHTVSACVDLSYLRDKNSNLELVSLFDDTQDIWREEHFHQLEVHSQIALWSSPDGVEQILKAA